MNQKAIDDFIKWLHDPALNIIEDPAKLVSLIRERARCLLPPPPKKSDEKMISIAVYYTRQQKLALETLCQITGVPVSVYIRKGIDLLIERERELDHLP